MARELNSLVLAVSALGRSVSAAEKHFSSGDRDLQETLRAGVIQHFEVAYEQCWKFIQRWIRENVGTEEADFPRTRKELFRIAARQGLIQDPLPWFDFGDARNLTSHTYDANKAESGYEVALKFLPYAQELLKSLRERND